MVNSLIALKIVNEERYVKEIKTVQKAINRLIVEKKITHIVNLVFLQYGIQVGWA